MNVLLWSYDYCSILANFSCYKDIYYEKYITNDTLQCYNFYYNSTHKMCVNCCQTSDVTSYSIYTSTLYIMIIMFIYVCLIFVL